MLVDAVTAYARNRAIANGAPLIAEIERYHYERSGETYNVIFKEPSLGFGTRRFVVYNPRDPQRVTTPAAAKPLQVAARPY